MYFSALTEFSVLSTTVNYLRFGRPFFVTVNCKTTESSIHILSLFFFFAEKDISFSCSNAGLLALTFPGCL